VTELILSVLLIVGVGLCVVQLDVFGPEKKDEKSSTMDDSN
jgi:hypothetical protein